MRKVQAYTGEQLYVWVMLCYHNRGFLKEYDRLHGTNLCRQGSQLDLLIDDSTDRSTSDMRGFVDFCAYILERLPEEALAELRTKADAP